MATIEDFKKIEIRVGRIAAAEPVPTSEKLVKLTVSFGALGERQIIAGIAKHYPDLSSMIGKKCAFVFNLEPRALMGLESQGMILAAKDTDALSLLTLDASITEGSLVQ